MEPLDLMDHPKDVVERRWIEFQKVGEVVQEMRTKYVRLYSKQNKVKYRTRTRSIFLLFICTLILVLASQLLSRRETWLL